MNRTLLEIGAVSRELGVAPDTLRSWERRYRLIVPHRGEHGQRLYDPDQVLTLRRVTTQIRRGHRARAAHDLAVTPGPLRTSRTRLEPCPQAPVLARRAVDALLEEQADTRFAFSLRLVASELVTNAVQYGSSGEPIQLDLKLFGDRAELQVQNRGSRLRIKNLRTKRPQAGRGLDIVDALADAWSIEAGPRGTKITVQLPVNTRPRSKRRPPSNAPLGTST
jgi:DNA-binding transcriptional MerR regulator